MIDISWDKIQRRRDELGSALARQSLDSKDRREMQRELSWLSLIIAKHTTVVALEKKIADLEAQETVNDDPALEGLFREEHAELTAEREVSLKELEDAFIAPDPLDDRCAYLEIRAGTGGQEAALFAADLLRMYTNYALGKGWKVSLESTSQTDLGGHKEVVVYIAGQGVYGLLKHESGVHRVQRVPATETSGRIHTSTATVAVLPEADDVDITIDPNDLRIDTYRSGGAGGQHVNRTDSAVRITHTPTGLVVACQDDRSQHKNKAKALKILKSRLLLAQREKCNQERSQQRREQVGTGQRAEKVRTYNYPQNRVTDHQVDVTLKNLDKVMEGALDPIIDALYEKDRAERKRAALETALLG